MATPRYSDLPQGAVVIDAPPPMQTPQYSDLPEGATLLSPPITEDNTQIAPGTDGPSIVAGLRALTKRRASPQELRDYVRASGGQLPPESEKYIDEVYASNPRETTFEPIVGPQPGAAASAWQGLQSGALMGWDDELNAQTRTAANWLGQKLGLNQSTASWDDIYNHYLGENQQYKDAAYKDHPWAYGAGFVPGMVLNTAVTRARLAPQSAAGRVAVAGAEGAGQGAISGAGNASPGERMSGALWGGGLGAGGGIVLAPLASMAGNVASRLWANVGSRGAGNELDTGLNALATRAPQDGQQMADTAAQWRASGVEPRLADVVDESGRGVIRDAASKMTPGRQAVVSHAADTYVDAQGRIANQARQHLGTERMTARQLGRQIEEEQTQLGPAFDADRQKPVMMTPEIMGALSTTEGMRTLRAIGGWMKPEERAQVDGLVAALNKAKKLGTPEEQAAKLMPGYDRMGADAQQAVMKQMVDQGMIVDPMANVNLTVDVADKFSRMITKQAREQPAMLRAAKGYSETLRGAARQQYKGYDQALNNFEANARVAEAANGTGRFEGSDFLKSPPDEYGHVVSQASDVPPPNSTGIPSEMGAMRLRARDQVVDRANESPAAAVGVARGMSQGEGQQARSAYLVGGRRANALSDSMGNELQRVQNSRYIDPNIGSQTAGRSHDAAMDAFHETVMQLSHAANPKWAIARAASSWLRKSGIRNVDAERLSRDAISSDPARVDAAIEFLSKRGLERSRADSFIRSMGAALGGRAAGAAVPSEAEQAPPFNSVRALGTNVPQGETK